MGPDGAQKKSIKQEGRGQGTTFEKIDIAQGHNINRLKIKIDGSKMTNQIQSNVDP